MEVSMRFYFIILSKQCFQRISRSDTHPTFLSL